MAIHRENQPRWFWAEEGHHLTQQQRQGRCINRSHRSQGRGPKQPSWGANSASPGFRTPGPWHCESTRFSCFREISSFRGVVTVALRHWRTSEEALGKTNGKTQHVYVFCTSCQCLQESICYTGALPQPNTWWVDVRQPRDHELPHISITEASSVYQRNIVLFWN